MPPSADAAFWSRFFRRTWDKHPAHLGQAIVSLITQQELFALSVAVAEALRDGDDMYPIRWCVDGVTVRLLQSGDGHFAHMPLARDRDFAGYAARHRSLPSFMFQLPNLQVLEPILWPRLQRFAGAVFSHVDVLSRRTWCDAYVGRYDRTPFGVHLDGASNFTFGLIGSKTLHLWEPEFYLARMRHADKFDFRRFVPHATSLTVSAGETIYWPGRFYHVAEPGGRFSVTMNVALYPRKPEEGFLHRAFEANVGDKESALPAFRGVGPSPALRRLARATARKMSADAFEHAVARKAAEHCTRLGFPDSPQGREKRRIGPRQQLALAAGCRIVCFDTAVATVVSANGRSLELKKHCKLQRAVAEVNRGRPLCLTDLRRLIGERRARALIEALWWWRAVDLSPAGTRAGT
jgi:hypothetical protein